MCDQCSCAGTAELTEEQMLDKLEEVLKEYRGKAGRPDSGAADRPDHVRLPAAESAAADRHRTRQALQRGCRRRGVLLVFSTVPRGKYLVRVCLGTACYVRGGKQVLDSVKKQLGIDVGETTHDRLFSLDVGRCFGACGLAPVIMVNDDVHQRVKPAKINELLNIYRAREAASRRGGEEVMTSGTTIKSPADLAALAKKKAAEEAALRQGIPMQILICMGGGCIASGAPRLLDGAGAGTCEAEGRTARRRALHRLSRPVRQGTGAAHRAGRHLLPERDARRCGRDRLLAHYRQQAGGAAAQPKRQRPARSTEQWPRWNFSNVRPKSCSRNCGRIDPLSIEEYIGRDGYAGLAKVLTGMKPDEVIDEMKRAGCAAVAARVFRPGSSGASPASRPVRSNTCSATRTRAIPGAFMDRSVLEGRPPQRDRGHGRRRLRGRRAQGYRLRARRIPAGRRAARHRHEAGARLRTAGKEHPRHAASTSTWRSAWAPARSSAAKRRR